MIVSKLKDDEDAFKEWVFNEFLDIIKLEDITINDSKKRK